VAGGGACELPLGEEDRMKGRCAIHVHNAGTVSQQRLGKRVTRLGPQRMSEVCSALRFSLRCEAQ
jgi:mRNA-degrading endonuclease toxin of MazEF toxin-antitoxin module